MANPEFFHAVISETKLDRFSTILYHHPQPFWYYLPVTALALLPWTVFVVAALVRGVSMWGASLKSTGAGEPDLGNQLSIFACCSRIVPLLFFSFSHSKLPRYILPVIPTE